MPAPEQVIFKYVREKFDITMSFSRRLGVSTLDSDSYVIVEDAKGDAVTDALVESGSLVVSSPNIRVTIKQGDPGQEYRIRFIGLSGTKVFEEDLILQVGQ